MNILRNGLVLVKRLLHPKLCMGCLHDNGTATALSVHYLDTLPTAEILSGKNVRAILVCGFLMKPFKKKYPEIMKKIVGAVWKLPAK